MEKIESKILQTQTKNPLDRIKEESPQSNKK